MLSSDISRDLKILEDCSPFRKRMHNWDLERLSEEIHKKINPELAHRVSRFEENPSNLNLLETYTLFNELVCGEESNISPNRILLYGLDPKLQMLLYEARGIYERVQEHKSGNRLYTDLRSNFSYTEMISLAKDIKFIERIYPNLSIEDSELVEGLKPCLDLSYLRQQGVLPDEVFATKEIEKAFSYLNSSPDTTSVVTPRNPTYYPEWRAIEMAIFMWNVQYDFLFDQKTEYFTYDGFSEHLDNMLICSDGFIPEIVSDEAKSAWKDELLKTHRKVCNFANEEYASLTLDYRINDTTINLPPHGHIGWKAVAIWISGDGPMPLFSYPEFEESLKTTGLKGYEVTPSNYDYLKYVLPNGHMLIAGSGPNNERTNMTLHETYPYATGNPRILFRIQA